MSTRRVTLTLGAAVGGLLAAALLPVAIAVADDDDFVPNPSTLNPVSTEDFLPFYEKVVGSEYWSGFDTTTGKVLPPADDLFGNDTNTTIGSFTNDDFLVQSSNPTGIDVPDGTQIDFANYGLGFGNEFIDIPVGTSAGMSDLFITPFGDFALFGTYF